MKGGFVVKINPVEEILQQLEKGENPTPPTSSAPPTKDRRGFVFDNYAMAPQKKVNDIGIRSLDESADPMSDE